MIEGPALNEIKVEDLKQEVVVKPVKCSTSECKRKPKKDEDYCQKCLSRHLEDEMEKERIERHENNRDKIVQGMFGMHLALYMNMEMLSEYAGVDLTDLPKDLISQREDMQVIYNQVYDEYGADNIVNTVGPIYALALTTVGQIGSRYVNNKKNLLKKESEKS